jgi:uncharacterized protein YbjT (DUF2867 family)
MNLVVGATGFLGLQIVQDLIASGRKVRALVRDSSDPERVAALRAAGAELVTADLKDPEALQRACAGVTNVFLSTTSTRSRADGDSIASVDRDGNLALVAAAKAAGVGHIVFISFPKHEVAFPLQDAKRAVEAAIQASGTGYTILQFPHFWEGWCSPALGFDAAGGTARIFGDGEGTNSWISLFDVAKAAVASIDNPATKQRVLQVGGPDPLSQNEIVRRFHAAGGRALTLETIPAEALRGQLATSTDDMERTFAALMLITAVGGWVFDPKEAREALGFSPGSIDGFLAVLAKS